MSTFSSHFDASPPGRVGRTHSYRGALVARVKERIHVERIGTSLDCVALGARFRHPNWEKMLVAMVSMLSIHRFHLGFPWSTRPARSFRPEPFTQPMLFTCQSDEVRGSHPS